jgi:hypothetical protein
MDKAELRALNTRFAPLPAELEQRIRAISTTEELEALLDRAVTATDLEEVRAGLPN